MKRQIRDLAMWYLLDEDQLWRRAARAPSDSLSHDLLVFCARIAHLKAVVLLALIGEDTGTF